MCDQLIWSKVWPSLESQFELIHIPIPSEDNIDTLLSSLSASMPEQDINLIGFSLGGYLATCLAELKPERFNKVLIVANSPCALPDEEMQQRLQAINWLKRFPYRGITQQKVNSMLAEQVSDRAGLTSIIEQMEQNLGYHRLLEQLQATSHRLDKSSFLASKQSRFQFCFGDEDKLVQKEWLTQLALEHGIVATEVSNCGHMMPLEQPERLVEITRKYFL
jgi:pimeloyl-ACP methyl ester carboxylesterase